MAADSRGTVSLDLKHCELEQALCEKISGNGNELLYSRAITATTNAIKSRQDK